MRNGNGDLWPPGLAAHGPATDVKALLGVGG
jgi:hypothetical protein